jgi:hypothetical protein
MEMRTAGPLQPGLHRFYSSRQKQAGATGGQRRHDCPILFGYK